MKATTPLNILTLAAAFAICHGTPALSQGSMDDMSHMEHMSMDHMDKHMALTPARPATHDDSVRALKVADELRRAIAKYQDTAAAIADGYKMFLPNVKQQRVYHFTNYGRAFKEAFRFNPAQPTSILYKRGADGTLQLIGAMYTMPKRASLSRLDDRIPLSIGRWHKHVNWCVPKKDEQARWAEQKNGAPVFGPESPIATKLACDEAGGIFHDTVFGWMIHVNVNAGTDLGQIFADVH